MHWISSKYSLIVCQTEKRLKPEHFMCRTGPCIARSFCCACTVRAKEMERLPSSVRIGEEAAVGVGRTGYSLICYRAAAPYNLRQVGGFATGSSAKLSLRFTPLSCLCYFFNGAHVAASVFRIASCFFPRIISEIVFQQINSPQSACYSNPAAHIHGRRQRGKLSGS